MIAPLLAAAVIIQASSPDWYCTKGPKVDGIHTLHCLMASHPWDEMVMTRPMFEPVDVDKILQMELRPPPLGRNRFRPKREPTE